jgi:lipopolysaccharide/colanic/teichoic acid biosynthesis glycosyltransferase
MRIPVEMVPEQAALVTPGARILGLWGLPLIPLGARGGGRVASAGKRFLDLAVSIPTLLLGLPLHLIQLVLLGRDGPRIVAEERIGRAGRPFRLLRYREPTPLTRVLRVMHLYPTLSQVVAGRASLVGIYPIPREVWDSLPEDERRDAPDAPAGLAGPWGRGPWSAGEVDQLLMLNRNYVRRWSLENDLRILFQRIPQQASTEGRGTAGGA